MISVKDITLKVPKFNEMDEEWMAQYNHDEATIRDAEFFIKVDGGGCVRYECHANLLNCRQCMFRFKCFTERDYFVLDAKTDSGLLYLRKYWGLLWGQHLADVGCGFATVIEHEKKDCYDCKDYVPPSNNSTVRLGYCQRN